MSLEQQPHCLVHEIRCGPSLQQGNGPNPSIKILIQLGADLFSPGNLYSHISPFLVPKSLNLITDVFFQHIRIFLGDLDRRMPQLLLDRPDVLLLSIQLDGIRVS